MEASARAQLRKATNIQLAKELPERLLKFFAMNPPRSTSDALSTSTSTSSQEGGTAILQKARPAYFNPFQPHKNRRTGRWHPPIYSLRQQAELVKMARNHDVEELLPYTVKNTEEKVRKREEQGLRVKGTGVGQKVKGHEWERTLKQRLEKRRQAMLDMPRLIQEWKQRGHGRWLKKWPSGKAGS